jgi:hypothetical protein
MQWLQGRPLLNPAALHRYFCCLLRIFTQRPEALSAGARHVRAFIVAHTFIAATARAPAQYAATP